jgi:hypothetical protein
MKPKSLALIYTILADDKPVAALEASGPEARELLREHRLLGASPTTMLVGTAVFVQIASPHSRNGLTINTPRRRRIRRRKCPLPVDGSGLPQRARCTPCRRKRRGRSAYYCFHAWRNLSAAPHNSTTCMPEIMHHANSCGGLCKRTTLARTTRQGSISPWWPSADYFRSPLETDSVRAGRHASKASDRGCETP